MSRARALARRRCASALRAYDWTMAPTMSHVVTSEWDDTTYDDLLKPALRVRATVVLDDEGEFAELTDARSDRSLS
jgi:hypothetical protein